VATASEIQRALGLGLDRLKLFPAKALGGPEVIAQFHGPFPDVRFMPSGGVDQGALPGYLALDAVFAVGGSWMVRPEWLAARDLASVERAAAATVELVAQVDGGAR